MAIQVTHIHACDAKGCDSVTEEGFTYTPGVTLPLPHAPGWFHVRGRDYCPKHTITMEIDQTAHRSESVMLA
jgi:hypothetical protein